MKSRNVQRATQRTVVQGSAGGETVVTSYPLAYYDQFSVIQDYVGPKNTEVLHNHQFVSTRYVDYTGTINSLGPGTNYGYTIGYVAPFTHHSSPGGSFAPPYMLNSIYNRALEQLYEQLRGQVDLSVSAAEWRQTRNMFISQLDHLKPMAEKLTKQVGRATRFLLQFSPSQWPKRWLEYQYGWKPLLSDIYHTGKQMMDIASYGYVRIVGEAYERTYENRKYTGPQFGSTEFVKSDCSQRCRIVAEFKLSNSAISSLSNYTSLNPVSIAWELMPYSFVADWFYDVGGYLRNLESALLFSNQVQKAYSVEGYRCKFNGSFGGGGSPGPGQTVYSSGNAYAEYTFKRRTVNIYLLPRAPNLRADLGWRRALSAASLLALHLGGVKKGLIQGPT